jgi:hypothetical protein
LYGLVSEAAFLLGVDVKSYSINIGLLDFKKKLVNIKEKYRIHAGKHGRSV